MRPRARAAAVYRHHAERRSAYAAPGGAAPTTLAAAAQTPARALQRRYPLVSALLAELDLMGEESRDSRRAPQRT